MAFWLTGILLTALTLAALLVPMYRRRGTASTPTAVGITAVLIGLPVCVVLIYRLIGDYPSAIQAPAAPASVATNPQGIPAIGEMVASLAARLKQNPDDLEGWLMLGRSYVSLEQFDAAREAYQRAYLSASSVPSFFSASFASGSSHRSGGSAKVGASTLSSSVMSSSSASLM